MWGHNVCFKEVTCIWKIIPKLSLLPLLISSTGFQPFCCKGNKFCDFLFPSLDDIALPNGTLRRENLYLKVGSCPKDDNSVQICLVLFCVVFA